MEDTYDYTYKDEKYTISFGDLEEKIKIYYNDKLYISKYNLNYINNQIKKDVNLNKIKKYEKIQSLTEKKKMLEKDFDIKKCLYKNINNNKLFFAFAYSNCLLSRWNLFPDNNNNDPLIDVFQINLHFEEQISKLSLIYINKNQNNNPIQEEINKIPKEFVVQNEIKSLDELKNLDNKIISNNETNEKKVVILENSLDLSENLTNFININYSDQLFIINIIKDENDRIIFEKK